METLKIIKIGGKIINDTVALQQFIEDLSKLKGLKILVHGGGNLASETSKQLGIKIEKVDGRRLTDQKTLDVVTMVYAGKLNKTIVAALQAKGCNSLGLTGADGNLIQSYKRPVTSIDYGFVGDIIQVNTSLIEILLKEEIVPVFCALTHDKQGQLLNTNADTIASELAVALASSFSVELYYCFEKKGVLSDMTNDNSVIETLDLEAYHTLFQQGKIADGMLPKLDNCFNALNNKVFKVCIGNPKMIVDSNSIYTTLQL
ncbi:acetylglutamate kinase [Psychroflexus lacisalsi]|jgi:acetylglutamate kinase|uniref:Acetylglutamate kinase n=1 Tax=Psychroflexus lacisalsi TaxID=503928 RepID=A0ABP3VID0_9FLAO|nr:acetylglutamate kinase [Psychroflexus lacisalsi]MBZ9619672.1 acetylglutamate kinase [Psychroflexus lacisalsi]